MINEAWTVLLISEPLFDPKRHKCEKEAYLVVRIRSHLSRLVRKAKKRQTGQLPRDVAARDSTPLDECIFAEGMAKHGACA